jgi:hypothetical protein
MTNARLTSCQSFTRSSRTQIKIEYWFTILSKLESLRNCRFPQVLRIFNIYTRMIKVTINLWSAGHLIFTRITLKINLLDTKCSCCTLRRLVDSFARSSTSSRSLMELKFKQLAKSISSSQKRWSKIMTGDTSQSQLPSLSLTSTDQ